MSHNRKRWTALGGLVVVAMAIAGCTAAVKPEPVLTKADCDDYSFEERSFEIGQEARVTFLRENATVIGVAGLPPGVAVSTPPASPGMRTYGTVAGPPRTYEVIVTSVLHPDGEVVCSLAIWTVTEAAEPRMG